MAHYFITGHTGFKGSWLTFLLKSWGHEVSGLALDPLPGSIFERTELQEDLVFDFREDVRNLEAVIKAIEEAKPDYLIHMAAQALVGEGHRNARSTYETNVLGTLNVLQAVENCITVGSQLIITTDKVYASEHSDRPFVESDPLGGKDPYSASKAMADILSQEYLSRSNSTPGAIARAGNVVGAGDVSRERLLPDLIRAAEAGDTLLLRLPEATRPWQHVLDCLYGYMLLLHRIGDFPSGSAWNFGPSANTSIPVNDVALRAMSALGAKVPLKRAPQPDFSETRRLALNSQKAEKLLGWTNLLPSEAAIDLSAVRSERVSRGLIEDQIATYNSMVEAHQVRLATRTTESL